jgi:hypothetical protein
VKKKPAAIIHKVPIKIHCPSSRDTIPLNCVQAVREVPYLEGEDGAADEGPGAVQAERGAAAGPAARRTARTRGAQRCSRQEGREAQEECEESGGGAGKERKVSHSRLGSYFFYYYESESMTCVIGVSSTDQRDTSSIFYTSLEII